MGAARVPGAPANGTILALWRSFASTADSIHTTHAERRAARQSSFTRTANATTPQVYPLLRRLSSARSPAYAVALAAADSAPDLRVRIRAELKSMTFSVTKLRADDAAACSTSSQYLTKRSSFASTAGGIRITHDPSEVENAHR